MLALIDLLLLYGVYTTIFYRRALSRRFLSNYTNKRVVFYKQKKENQKLLPVRIELTTLGYLNSALGFETPLSFHTLGMRPTLYRLSQGSINILPQRIMLMYSASVATGLCFSLHLSSYLNMIVLERTLIFFEMYLSSFALFIHGHWNPLHASLPVSRLCAGYDVCPTYAAQSQRAAPKTCVLRLGLNRLSPPKCLRYHPPLLVRHGVSLVYYAFGHATISFVTSRGLCI